MNWAAAKKYLGQEIGYDVKSQSYLFNLKLLYCCSCESNNFLLLLRLHIRFPDLYRRLWHSGNEWVPLDLHNDRTRGIWKTQNGKIKSHLRILSSLTSPPLNVINWTPNYDPSSWPSRWPSSRQYQGEFRISSPPRPPSRAEVGGLLLTAFLRTNDIYIWWIRSFIRYYCLRLFLWNLEIPTCTTKFILTILGKVGSIPHSQ